MIRTNRDRLRNSSCRCNPLAKTLAFSIRLGIFSCRGYGKLVVAIQELRDRPTRRVFHKIEVFDPGQHKRESDKSSGNQNKDRDFRNDQKQSRDQK